MTAAPLEHAEAAMLIRAVRGLEPAHPELRLLYAIPNGGKRSRKTAADLKAEGVRSGVPDYCLPVARGVWHGLYLELKRLRGGRVEPEQRAWLSDLEAQGYRAVVCRGWEQALAEIRDYLAADAVAANDGGE
ncbi:MAG: VRR-NUC domain-containing protein [Pseudoxanthomonas sp.]|nr:VRR-NUC domain-containing protein [Pseudoxanthomonas sp.]